MTPKKRLFELKKELRHIQRKIYKYSKLNHVNYSNYKDIVDYCFPKYINSYTIITSNKKRYIINCFTNEFPADLNFSRILYICKTKCSCRYKTMKNGTYKKIDPNWIKYDSYTGKMYELYDAKYNLFIDTKFPYTETIGQYED